MISTDSHREMGSLVGAGKERQTQFSSPLCCPVQAGDLFRTFLLSSLKNFLVAEWEKSRAQKRGGAHNDFSGDEQKAEDRNTASLQAKTNVCFPPNGR